MAPRRHLVPPPQRDSMKAIAPRRPAHDARPTVRAMRPALLELREATLMVVALLDLATAAALDGDSDEFGRRYIAAVDQARRVRELARALDDAVAGRRRGCATDGSAQ